jgi:hypothetical protein
VCLYVLGLCVLCVLRVPRRALPVQSMCTQCPSGFTSPASSDSPSDCRFEVPSGLCDTKADAVATCFTGLTVGGGPGECCDAVYTLMSCAGTSTSCE